ncbi:MAG: hypothetical protein U0T80_01475 [Flavobacteriaceae bacterium]
MEHQHVLKPVRNSHGNGVKLPTATITGTEAVCVGDTAQVVLTGSGGTSPYTFAFPQ